MLRPTILCAVLCTAPAAAAAAEPVEFPSRTAIGKAGDLLGTRVETPDGEDLGQVSDFALELSSGRIAYVVVSVGSFLIEDSLIAVDPAALQAAPDNPDRLVINADTPTLQAARRFSADDWPLTADVTAAPQQRADTPGDDDAEPASADRGRATISDGRKTATLSAGERRIQLVESEEAAPATESAAETATEGKAAQGGEAGPDAPSRPEPDTRFGRLDRDGDGALNRAEIAHELSRDDRFADIDRNGDGRIDATEFDVWQEDGGSADGSGR